MRILKLIKPIKLEEWQPVAIVKVDIAPDSGSTFVIFDAVNLKTKEHRELIFYMIPDVDLMTFMDTGQPETGDKRFQMFFLSQEIRSDILTFLDKAIKPEEDKD